MNHDPSFGGEVYRSAVIRNDGLRRVSSLTRRIVAGSIALTAVIGFVAARTFPGTSSSAAVQPTNDGGESGNTSRSSSSGLQSPSTSLLPGSGSGQVVTGAS